MRSPATPTPECLAVKRVDHLPLVGAMRRELAVNDTLDALIPPHERHAVTVGAGVEALVLTIRTGEPALSRLADTLASDDVAVIFQRPLEAAHVHDNRWGRALDALGTMGLARREGAVLSPAIQQEALDRARLHAETTSRKVSGAYERAEDAEGPRLTFGSRRDHRPALKPRLCGLTGTADGVAVWGQVAEGNRRDTPAHRFPITQRRQPRPALGEPLLLAARKVFAGETMALAAAHRRRLITLVPQTVGLRQEVVDSPERSARPRRWEQPSRRTGQGERSHGASVRRPSRGKTAAGEGQEVLLR